MSEQDEGNSKQKRTQAKEGLQYQLETTENLFKENKKRVFNLVDTINKLILESATMEVILKENYL